MVLEAGRENVQKMGNLKNKLNYAQTNHHVKSLTDLNLQLQLSSVKIVIAVKKDFISM